MKNNAITQKKRASIIKRRAERELLFWTAREVLKLIVFALVVAYLAKALVDGQVISPERLPEALIA